jgi:hypothetical protein
VTEHISKAALLELLSTSYERFNALLAPLSEAQLTTAGVNGAWSVKDNLAHISAWQKSTLGMIQAVREHQLYVKPFPPEMSEEAINEHYFQQNKDRSLADVQGEFQERYQQMVQAIEGLSEEAWNEPQAWLRDKPIWMWIRGNGDEHYDEHYEIVQRWLAENSKFV